MILLFRKYLVKIFFIFSFISVLFGVFYFIKFQPGNNSSSFVTTQVWWMIYRNVIKIDLFHAWISLMALGLFSLVFSFFIYRLIKKNSSPQMAFIYLFIFSFSFSLLRLIYIMPHSAFIDRELISRIIFFGRLFGLSSFFAASLFTSGLQIQKFGLVLLISTVVSFTITIILPFNTTVLTSALIYRVGEEKSITLFCLTLEILTVLNYLSSALKQSRNELFRIMFFALMILTGFEMSFFLYLPILIPGITLLILGTLLYLRTSQKLFLWS